MAGLAVGFVHLEIAGRAGAVILAGAADRLPIEAADIFGERLGIEKAEPMPGFDSFFSMNHCAGTPAIIRSGMS